MEVGIYYYRARYFSVTLGRFLQRDPIGYEGGINLYSYCGNSPNDYTDPMGLLYLAHQLGNEEGGVCARPAIVGVDDQVGFEEIPNAKPGDETQAEELDDDTGKSFLGRAKDFVVVKTFLPIWQRLWKSGGGLSSRHGKNRSIRPGPSR
jgi:uncharacterized protein RhaS with RHS repeats